MKHCLLPITSFLDCLFINLTFWIVNIRFCLGVSIYPCSTSSKAYWLRWVLGDVSCNVLINVFYVSLICIGLYHVTYLYRKKGSWLHLWTVWRVIVSITTNASGCRVEPCGTSNKLLIYYLFLTPCFHTVK